MSENGNNGDTENAGILPYDRWVEESLRSVICRALEYASENGLPGDHHYYITFRTQHPDVHIPGHLRAQHPDTMTIVLQHQFDGLAIRQDGFDVTLRFGGKPEALSIPLEAVTAFHDPAVSFGLQLNVKDLGDDLSEEIDVENDDLKDTVYQDTDEDDKKTGEVIALDQFRKK